jgi:preprotein translocase subunit YajC
MGGFLILIVILGALWALFVLPSKRRRNQHSAMQDSTDVGDEIITAGGLHGRVIEIEDSTARIEIAPGVIVTLDRRAIAAVAREIDVEIESESEPDSDFEPDRDDHAPADEKPETSAEPR